MLLYTLTVCRSSFLLMVCTLRERRCVHSHQSRTLPSSIQTRGLYSPASDPPQLLHVTKYDSVFMLAVASQAVASEYLLLLVIVNINGIQSFQTVTVTV